MISHVYHTELPWSSSRDEDQRFNKILGVLAVVFLVLSIVVTVLKVPALTRAEKEQLPPQLARVMLQKQELPAPKVVEPPKVEEKKNEEKKPEEKKPEKKIEAVKPLEKPLQTPPTKKEVIDRAKEQAQAQIATFKDDLMEMREMAQTTMVETASATLNDAASKATQVDRSMINSGQTKGSGGINVGAYASHDTGGTALSGRETTKVKSGLAEASKKAAGATAGGAGGGGNSDGAGGAARSEEDMRKVMEQHKSSIFSIYNRALRDNAALQGKVKFKIVIDPSGQVVDVAIEFSELKEPALEAKLIAKLKSISFPSAAVLRTTFYQTLDFLPQ